VSSFHVPGELCLQAPCTCIYCRYWVSQNLRLDRSLTAVSGALCDLQRVRISRGISPEFCSLVNMLILNMFKYVLQYSVCQCTLHCTVHLTSFSRPRHFSRVCHLTFHAPSQLMVHANPPAVVACTQLCAVSGHNQMIVCLSVPAGPTTV
jgi:hypothetical protein